MDEQLEFFYYLMVSMVEELPTPLKVIGFAIGCMCFIPFCLSYLKQQAIKETKRQVLINAYFNTVENIGKDAVIPGSISQSNNTRIGPIVAFYKILGRFRGEGYYTEDRLLIDRLLAVQRDAAALDVIVAYIVQSPNLFNRSEKSDYYHFVNHFLCELCRVDFPLFREVFQRAFRVKLLSGPVTLYRRTDAFTPEHVFEHGLQLAMPDNAASVAKFVAMEPYTYRVGVSVSDIVLPAKKFGPIYGWKYYEIVIPRAEDFLIIDIKASQRNFGKPDEGHVELNEQNIMNNIPPQYIKSVTDDSVQCGGVFGLFKRSYHEENRKKFDPEYSYADRPRIAAGAYCR